MSGISNDLKLEEYTNNRYVQAIGIVILIGWALYTPPCVEQLYDNNYFLMFIIILLIGVATKSLKLAFLLGIAFIISFVNYHNKSADNEMQKLIYFNKMTNMQQNGYNDTVGIAGNQYSYGTNNPSEPQYPTIDLRDVSFGPKEPSVPLRTFGKDSGYEVGTTSNGCYGMTTNIQGFDRDDNLSSY